MTATADASALAGDATAGLWSDPPVLPTKWLYDERGSKLFDEITRLPEYYPTRREATILADHAADIAADSGAQSIIEFGSGTSTKTRLLLEAFGARTAGASSVGTVPEPPTAGGSASAALTYVPLDVSREILESAARTLLADYTGLAVAPTIADFTDADLRLPDSPGPRLVVFLGGTIGNFTESQRIAFLATLAGAMSSGDCLLLGADLIKDIGRVVAAYNDKQGVTADFNKNMIEVLRNGLAATGLYADDFDHVARWNPRDHRIEMWLRARREVTAYFAAIDRDWHLAAGTEVLTEISTKFDQQSIASELATAGFAPVTSWTDPLGDFLLTLVRRT